MTNPWLLLGTAIVAEVIGTSALKASAGFTRLEPQRLDAPALIGMALIVVGVLLMNLSSTRAGH